MSTKSVSNYYRGFDDLFLLLSMVNVAYSCSVGVSCSFNFSCSFKIANICSPVFRSPNSLRNKDRRCSSFSDTFTISKPYFCLTRSTTLPGKLKFLNFVRSNRKILEIYSLHYYCSDGYSNTENKQ